MGTQERKLWRILHELETALRTGDQPAIADFTGFLAAVARVEGQSYLPGLSGIVALAGDQAGLLRAVNALRHALGQRIGREAAEWDLFPPAGPSAEPEAAILSPGLDNRPMGLNLPVAGPCRLVYCDDIRSPFNLGSIFRTAWAFGLDGLVLSAGCPDPAHPRCERSAMGACATVPWLRLPEALAAFAEANGLQPFALELGGADIGGFSFPERGLAVLGSEELGVDPALLDWCRERGGVVSIPLPGAKASLNVGVSFGILAANWRGKHTT